MDDGIIKEDISSVNPENNGESTNKFYWKHNVQQSVNMSIATE